MVRIAGVDLPDRKRVEVGLTYIFGVGRKLSQRILAENSINLDTKVSQLSDEQANQIRASLNQYSIEGDLRRNVSLAIKRVMDLGNYKGLRHRRRMPVRGQRTKTNARTRKGPRRFAGSGKK